MCASPFRFLRAGPPPPKVALLPDAMFFTRAVPITPGATAAEAANQVELALEAVSPFPLAQLYYGSFWQPGAEHALVFAAYRRRFTSDQIADWDGAELVLPAFAAVLGANVEPASTVVIDSADGLTAVHWEKPAVPSKVVFTPIAPDAAPEVRAQAREETLRALGGSRSVVDLAAPPAPDAAQTDGEYVFRSGEFVVRLPARTATTLDVRDKGELAALRNAHKRDVMLWRTALGSAVALLLLVVGEVALFAGRQWQQVRGREIEAQRSVVEKISSLHDLANRIDEIATKRLLPIEMVTTAAQAKPEEITFTQAGADRSRGLHTLLVQGTTANPAQISAYESALRALPAVESATAAIAQMRAERTNFTLTVVFKPDALRPMQSQKPTSP